MKTKVFRPAAKENSYLVDVLTPTVKFKQQILILVWAVTLLWFWLWWSQAQHLTTPFNFLITSFILFWSTVVPGWYFYFTSRMKKPNPQLPLPQGRVAMVVTKAPIEPWLVVRKTLLAMLSQKFPQPFDVWLADEAPTPAVQEWCVAHGVQISTRQGHRAYHRAVWPRRTRCKEGNLAFFYDHYGYAQYDFVVQMDADHHPANADYLRNMIAPFINPTVGYVAAPSICNANQQESWTVRARLYVEAGLHGALQAGYNGGGWSPMMIGSHYAVRTAALKEIGGLGPELAEDASTTLFMNNAGWQGVFALDALAQGDGAVGLAESAFQEFQWSQSLMRLALEWTPRYSSGLTWQKKIEFSFAQWWYPIFGLQMLLAVLSPGIALLTGSPWVSVNYFDFWWRFAFLTITCLLPIEYVRRQGCFRPADAPLLSWETVLFQLIRWPWVFLGCSMGVLATIFKRNFNFKITQKGQNKQILLPPRFLTPYFLVVFFSGGLAILTRTDIMVEGYRWLAILDVITYSLTILWLIALHAKENAGKETVYFKKMLPNLLLNVCCFFLILGTISTALPRLETILVQQQFLVVSNSLENYVGVRSAAELLPEKTPETSFVIEAAQEAAELLPRNHTPLPIVAFPKHKPIFSGSYDPGKILAGFTFDLDHEYVYWDYPQGVDQAITKSQRQSQFPLLTIEPRHREGLLTANLLLDTSQGVYDQEILAVAQAIKKHAPQKIMFRWGHEMDLCGVYDWSTCVAPDFISAYRHVVDLMRQQGVENVLYVWSPGGNSNAPEFYPGDDYVDYVAMTLLVAEDWDKLFNAAPPYPQAFETAFVPRYNRLAQFQKPVFIAEMGISYSDPKINRTPWLTAAFLNLDTQRYPLFCGWVYFNNLSAKSKELHLWPDFQISREELANALLAAQTQRELR